MNRLLRQNRLLRHNANRMRRQNRLLAYLGVDHPRELRAIFRLVLLIRPVHESVEHKARYPRHDHRPEQRLRECVNVRGSRAVVHLAHGLRGTLVTKHVFGEVRLPSQRTPISADGFIGYAGKSS
jgi:hypothetical protein|eukprot:COSAG06_NODE_5014_length_3790_cov_618.530750_2_plen_125_part_00